MTKVSEAEVLADIQEALAHPALGNVVGQYCPWPPVPLDENEVEALECLGLEAVRDSAWTGYPVFEGWVRGSKVGIASTIRFVEGEPAVVWYLIAYGKHNFEVKREWYSSPIELAGELALGDYHV